MFRFYSQGSKVRVAVVGEHSEGVLKIAVSRCSTKDAFVRKKGRMIAEGRLQKGKLYSQEKIENCDVKTFVEKAKEIAEKLQTSMIVCHDCEEN